MKFLKVLSCFILILTFLSGCSGKPILNVEQASVNYDLPESKVKQAIMEAGSNRGWLMSVQDNGVIRAELNLRSHQAIVHIPYTKNSYSIQYVSSINLNEKNGKIHKNYNNWIMNLNQDIQLKLNQYNLATTE